MDLGWANGKRQRKVVTGQMQAETRAKLRAAQRDADQGIITDGRLSVEVWLGLWLTTVIEGRVGSDNTRRHYRQIVDRHLCPALGSVRIDRLTPEQVDRFLAAKASAGLSRTYIGRMRTTLIDALRHAERRGIVPRNVAALSVMPRTKPATPRTSLTAVEARRLLDAAAGDSIEDVADLLGDDPATVLRHYRHKIRPVADAALRMQAVLGG